MEVWIVIGLLTVCAWFLISARSALTEISKNLERQVDKSYEIAESVKDIERQVRTAVEDGVTASVAQLREDWEGELRGGLKDAASAAIAESLLDEEPLEELKTALTDAIVAASRDIRRTDPSARLL